MVCEHHATGVGASGSQVTSTSPPRDHGGSSSSASGTSPHAPFVGRGGKWRATSTSWWAEGPLSSLFFCISNIPTASSATWMEQDHTHRHTHLAPWGSPTMEASRGSSSVSNWVQRGDLALKTMGFCRQQEQLPREMIWDGPRKERGYGHRSLGIQYCW